MIKGDNAFLESGLEWMDFFDGAGLVVTDWVTISRTARDPIVLDGIVDWLRGLGYTITKEEVPVHNSLRLWSKPIPGDPDHVYEFAEVAGVSWSKFPFGAYESTGLNGVWSTIAKHTFAGAQADEREWVAHLRVTGDWNESVHVATMWFAEQREAFVWAARWMRNGREACLTEFKKRKA